MGCRSPVEVESSVRRFWEGGERASCAARHKRTRSRRYNSRAAAPGGPRRGLGEHPRGPPRRPLPAAALTSRGVAAPAALAPSAAGSGGRRRHGVAAAPAAVLPGGRGSARRMSAAGAPPPAEPRAAGVRPFPALGSRDPRPLPHPPAQSRKHRHTPRQSQRRARALPGFLANGEARSQRERPTKVEWGDAEPRGKGGRR